MFIIFLYIVIFVYFFIIQFGFIIGWWPAIETNPMCTLKYTLVIILYLYFQCTIFFFKQFIIIHCNNFILYNFYKFYIFNTSEILDHVYLYKNWSLKMFTCNFERIQIPQNSALHVSDTYYLVWAIFVVGHGVRRHQSPI